MPGSVAVKKKDKLKAALQRADSASNAKPDMLTAFRDPVAVVAEPEAKRTKVVVPEVVVKKVGVTVPSRSNRSHFVCHCG